MSYLLGTNAVSEATMPRPDAAVVRWLAEVAEVDEVDDHLSALTLGELRGSRGPRDPVGG